MDRHEARKTERVAEHPIDPLFLERWSPRAFDGAAMEHGDLLTILEASRWAPSAFNLQPWHFLCAHRDDEFWPLFLHLLIPWNQIWARNASVLVYVLSDTLAPNKHGGFDPSYSHSFDAGAAWAMLALQATRMGFYAHAMSGFDHSRVQTDLHVPERFRVEAAVAVGRMGDRDLLSHSLRARETPTSRRPILESITRGPLSGRPPEDEADRCRKHDR